MRPPLPLPLLLLLLLALREHILGRTCDSSTADAPAVLPVPAEDIQVGIFRGGAGEGPPHDWYMDEEKLPQTKEIKNEKHRLITMTIQLQVGGSYTGGDLRAGCGSETLSQHISSCKSSRLACCLCVSVQK